MIAPQRYAAIKAWRGAEQLEARVAWDCGYCGKHVAARLGYQATIHGDGSGYGDMIVATIRICPNCQAPVFVVKDQAWPVAPPGRHVFSVPGDVLALYDDARRSAGSGAFTSAVLTCRKILMHVAVQKGAKPGATFLSYVEHLANTGHVPPDGRGWVDYVRTRSNEANHEINLMGEQDAFSLIGFVEMLLRFIYELPAMAPTVPGNSNAQPSAS